MTDKTLANTWILRRFAENEVYMLLKPNFYSKVDPGDQEYLRQEIIQYALEPLISIILYGCHRNESMHVVITIIVTVVMIL